MFVVAYCPDFYIQCERLFKPELINQTLIVASQNKNRESRILACSAQAKALGFRPGKLFAHLNSTIIELESDYPIRVCKPNFELYADLSRRFIKSLELLSPRVEALASDEAVLELDDSNFEDKISHSHGIASEKSIQCLLSHAKSLRKTLRHWLGLSAVIIIAPSKTLAQLAARTTLDNSHYHGVVDLRLPQQRRAVLRHIAINDIDGISKKAACGLSEINIHNALELSEAPKPRVRLRSSVLIERIAIELSGIDCQAEPITTQDQDIAPLISNQAEAHSIIDAKQILKTHVAQAVDHLIAISSNCGAVTICLARIPLGPASPTFRRALKIALPKATNSRSIIEQHAIQLLECLWHESHHYLSLHLSLEDLTLAKANQFSLFADESSQTETNKNVDTRSSIRLETVLSGREAMHVYSNRPQSPSSFSNEWATIPRVC